jgi:hypothetical protein
MTEDNILQKIKNGNPCPNVQPEDLKRSGEDGVLEDVRSMNVRNWKNVAQNRGCWKGWLSEPEPYAGCSAEEEEEEEEEEEGEEEGEGEGEGGGGEEEEEEEK